MMLGITIVVHSVTAHLADSDCGFTSDFRVFLRASYPSAGFQSSIVRCGEYGGKASPDSLVKLTPVIFIHGNSDVAYGRGTADGYKDWQTGFRSLATYFMGHGYTSAELYTFTWGNGNDSLASQNYHRQKDIAKIRLFIKAVLDYTKAPQVNIIAHSMGVTLGRKAVKGGSGKDEATGPYDIGPSIAKQVLNFVGIAGANLGLTSCYQATIYPTCSKLDGFYPGLLPTSGPSTFLAGLKDGNREGDRVYSIWSQFDDLIGFGCVVYGKITSRIDGQNGEVEKRTADWTHFKLRDGSGPDVLDIFAKTS